MGSRAKPLQPAILRTRSWTTAETPPAMTKLTAKAIRKRQRKEETTHEQSEQRTQPTRHVDRREVCSVIELMRDDYTHTLRISDAVNERYMCHQ